MAQSRYDFARIMKEGENETLYARGILTCNVPGLVKTKTGKLVTPTLKVDEQGNLQNFFYKDSQPLPLYDYSGDGKEKVLVQPSMVGKTKEKKILLWVNENGKDSFFALEAWETQAKRMNMFFKKGESICVLAHKVISKGATTGQKEVVWCIDDIIKTQKDIVYEKKVNENTSTATSTPTPTEETKPSNGGFLPVSEDEADLPFGN